MRGMYIYLKMFQHRLLFLCYASFEDSIELAEEIVFLQQQVAGQEIFQPNAWSTIHTSAKEKPSSFF